MIGIGLIGTISGYMSENNEVFFSIFAGVVMVGAFLAGVVGIALGLMEKLPGTKQTA